MALRVIEQWQRRSGQGWAQLQRPAQLKSAVDAQEIVNSGLARACNGVAANLRPGRGRCSRAEPRPAAILVSISKACVCPIEQIVAPSSALTPPASSLRVATERRKLSGFARQHIICALCSFTPPTFLLAHIPPPRLSSPSVFFSASLAFWCLDSTCFSSPPPSSVSLSLCRW